jgi:hypothetical protein
LAATTERKERRAKAKEKEKSKTMAEGREEGAAYAAPPTSPQQGKRGRLIFGARLADQQVGAVGRGRGQHGQGGHYGRDVQLQYEQEAKERQPIEKKEHEPHEHAEEAGVGIVAAASAPPVLLEWPAEVSNEGKQELPDLEEEAEAEEESLRQQCTSAAQEQLQGGGGHAGGRVPPHSLDGTSFPC